ncbi:MAG TPA: cobalamin-binding protein [Clostridia bacterium]|nr:cobalamin-binding protein [Clostridia bacterium]
MGDELIKAIAELDEERAIYLVKQQIEAGRSCIDIVEDCRRGVEIVGKKYSQGEYFLSDLVMSEEVFRCVMQVLEPYLAATNPPGGVPVVMGTVEGDIHDLGKNIVTYILRSHGFCVYDLGVNVPPEKFVKAVNETGARYLGLSVLLSFCVGSVKKVVDLLKEVGLRDKVKVVVGGYPVDEIVKEYTGVDAYAQDINQALRIFKKDILP